MRDDETTAIPGSPAARDGENPHFLVVGIGASAGGACSPTALSTTRSTVSCSTSWTSPSAVRPKNFAGGPRCWKSRPAFLGSQNVLIFGLDGRITIWNQGCERLYGYSREEALGRIAHELLGTVFPMPLAEIKAQLLRTGAWDGELSHVKRDGERITVASRWVLHRNENGEPSAILEANHDISERTRAEETLRQADRRKDEFLAMLAHELRNPLAAVQSSFELLSDSGDDGDSMRLARGVMDRQIKLLIRLVDDLLDIERLALGKIPLCNEQIDVATVVEAALETTRPSSRLTITPWTSPCRRPHCTSLVTARASLKCWPTSSTMLPNTPHPADASSSASRRRTRRPSCGCAITGLAYPLRLYRISSSTSHRKRPPRSRIAEDSA